MRGVPSIDASSIQVIAGLIERQHAGGGEVHLVGLQPRVVRLIERSGIHARIGEERIHWSADGAIVAVDLAHAPVAQPQAALG